MRYAIIESGGKQYKAVEGQTIEVDLLSTEVGKKLRLDDVLLVADGDNVMIGSPTVSGASVSTSVLDHFKAPKIIIFKYHPRKRYRLKKGHRQQYTRLMVDSIDAKGMAKAAVKEEAPEEAKAAPQQEAKTETPKAEQPNAETKAAAKEEPSTRKKLSSFEFNARTLAALEDAGVTTVAAALKKLEEGDDAVLEINGIGPAGLDEIKDVLKKAGYTLPK
jgi:large subunit ribosomal protein L21